MDNTPPKIKAMLELESAGRLNEKGQAVLSKARDAGLIPAASSAVDQGLRKAEYASRGFVDSALETVGAIPDLVAKGTNALGFTNISENFYTDKLKQGFNVAGKTISAPLNAIAPNAMKGPMTGADKLAYGAGRGAGDAASVMLPAAAVAKATKAGTTAHGVGTALKGQPVLQAASGSVGGSVGEYTDNPYLGILASLGVPATSATFTKARNAAKMSKAKRAAIGEAKTSAQLKTEASRLYDDAEKGGALVKAASFDGVHDELTKLAQREGARKKLHPKIMDVLDTLAEDKGRDITVQDLKLMRRQIGIALDDFTNKDQIRIGKALRDRFDDYVSGLKDSDLVEGSIAGSADKLSGARKLYSRAKKTELIEEAVAKAKDTASGPENGLRIEFRKILNNPKKLRGFSDEEIQAMQEVVRGTPGRNAQRWLGKFGLGLGQNTNAVGAALGLGGGYAMGGPMGSLALTGAGTAARYGAHQGTKKAANYARALASGVPNVNVPLSSQAPNANLAAAILMARLKGNAKR